MQVVQVDELASNMRPTCRFEHAAAVVEFREAALAIGLHNSVVTTMPELLSDDLVLFD